MVESILLHLLIGLIIFGCLFAVVHLILPSVGLPPQFVQAAYIVLACIFLVWLVWLILPLAHVALP